MSDPGRPSLWRGPSVAATTPFGDHLELDLTAFGDHLAWMTSHGIRSVVVCGSLGEGSALAPFERTDLAAAAVRTVGGDVPVIAAVGSARTAEGVEIARSMARAGVHGLLVLPPYVYRGDWRETRAHVGALLRATDLPCMVYNNPTAYGTDVLPEQILDLVEEHPTLTGVKESSGDVRRITAIRALVGERVDVSVGLDDCLLEGVAAGAVGWVSGLANAMPTEAATLFERLAAGAEGAVPEYARLLPLLRLDTRPKFVQFLKQLQAELGHGNPRVRPPRLGLTDEEVAEVRRLLEASRGAALPTAARA